MAATSLSARQLELLKAVIEVTKSDVDWAAVAEKAEYKTSKYARDTWTNVKAKLVSGKVSATSLSARQLDLVKAYVELMQGTTDWTAVAKSANFKTSKYARDSWTGVKNKLVGLQTSSANDTTGGNTEAAEGNEDPPAPKAKKASTARKRKTIPDEAEEPTQKSKKRKSKSTATVKSESDDDGDAAVEEDPARVETSGRSKTTTPVAEEGATVEGVTIDAEGQSEAQIKAEAEENVKTEAAAKAEAGMESDNGSDTFGMF